MKLIHWRWGKLLIGLLLLICLGETSAAAATPLENLAQRLQVKIISDKAVFPIRTPHGAISGRPPRGAALQAYAAMFVKEFGRYPRELMQATRLKRVVFCEDLAFAGQRRTAVPDFQHHTLYLDVKRGANVPAYLVAVLHHEFFHMIDLRDDGRVYEDRDWARLNAPNFRYGAGGRSAQGDADTSVLTDKFPGFLNHYSTTGVEEDKAEVFAHLVATPQFVSKRMKVDGVLRAKVHLLKKQLKAFCPQMDASFWPRVD